MIEMTRKCSCVFNHDVAAVVKSITAHILVGLVKFEPGLTIVACPMCNRVLVEVNHVLESSTPDVELIHL